jgi:universal stress protein E
VYDIAVSMNTRNCGCPQIAEEPRGRGRYVARPLRDQKIKVTVTAEWDFPAYEAILRQAHRRHIDLIVAEQHAGRHRAAGLLHLTDWELLRLSPTPVLLVKTPGTYRHPVVLAAVDPGHAYAKPAKLDQQILRTSGTIARALRGALHVVHAYSPLPFEIQPTLAVGQETIDKLNADAEVAARRRFDRVLRSSHIAEPRRHLVRGAAGAAIEKSAAELHSSIVVMGAISRSGLSRIFIGNTAERVLDHLNCDILIVRPTHFASRVSRARRGVRVMAVGSGP